MYFTRLPPFVLLTVVASVLTMSLATEGMAQGYYGRGYGSNSYRVPYRNVCQGGKKRGSYAAA